MYFYNPRFVVFHNQFHSNLIQFAPQGNMTVFKMDHFAKHLFPQEFLQWGFHSSMAVISNDFIIASVDIWCYSLKVLCLEIYHYT